MKSALTHPLGRCIQHRSPCALLLIFGVTACGDEQVLTGSAFIEKSEYLASVTGTWSDSTGKEHLAIAYYEKLSGGVPQPATSGYLIRWERSAASPMFFVAQFKTIGLNRLLGDVRPWTGSIEALDEKRRIVDGDTVRFRGGAEFAGGSVAGTAEKYFDLELHLPVVVTVSNAEITLSYFLAKEVRTARKGPLPGGVASVDVNSYLVLNPSPWSVFPDSAMLLARSKTSDSTRVQREVEQRLDVARRQLQTYLGSLATSPFLEAEVQLIRR